jgi:nicotinamidase-related amidase
MAPNETVHAGLSALLAPEDSVLLLVDHQAFQFANMHSHEPQLVVGNVLALARTAKIFGVQDPKLVDAVKKTGRRQLVIAGLWTEVCVAMPAIQAQGEGFDVYAVTDASGGVRRGPCDGGPTHDSSRDHANNLAGGSL